MMDLFDTILITIESARGKSISGRTTIQKLIYFFKERELVKVNYRPYYFGPFSSAVTNSLDELVTYHFLNESVDTPGTTGYSNVNPDWKRYTYQITDDGRQVASLIKERHPQEVNQIADTIGICYEHDQLDPNLLSWAAKVRFISTQNNAINQIEGVKAAALEYNWTLSDNQIRSGIELLKKLNFL